MKFRNRWLWLLLLVGTMAFNQTAVVAQTATPSPALEIEAMRAAVNDLRARRQLAPYRYQPLLAGTAQQQANHMAARQTVTHTGPDNSDAAQRVAATGYPARGTEIIYGGPGSYEKAIAWWLNSPLHHSLLLSDRYFEFGVGRAVGENGFTYWAIVFGAAEPPLAVEPQLTVVEPAPASVEQPPAGSARRPYTRSQAPLLSGLNEPLKVSQPEVVLAQATAVAIQPATPSQAVLAATPTPLLTATTRGNLSLTLGAYLTGAVILLLAGTAVYRRQLRFPAKRHNRRSGTLSEARRA